MATDDTSECKGCNKECPPSGLMVETAFLKCESGDPQITITVTALCCRAKAVAAVVTGFNLLTNQWTLSSVVGCFPAPGVGVHVSPEGTGRVSWTGKSGDTLTGVTSTYFPNPRDTCFATPAYDEVDTTYNCAMTLAILDQNLASCAGEDGETCGLALNDASIPSDAWVDGVATVTRTITGIPAMESRTICIQATPVGGPDCQGLAATSKALEVVSCVSSCPGGIPMVIVTVSWTDSDLTKEFFGIVFTKGETKTICPSHYACHYTSFTSPGGYFFTYLSEEEVCIPPMSICFDAKNNRALYIQTPTPWIIYFNEIQDVVGHYYSNYLLMRKRHFSNSATHLSNYENLSECNINPAEFPLGPTISNTQFGQVTTTSGLTIKWQRGPGPWGGCF